MSDSLVLVDLDGSAKAFLEPDEISLTRVWCGGASIAAKLDVLDPKAAELSIASRALQLWIDGSLRFHGKVAEPMTSSHVAVNVAGADPWAELGTRMIQADETYTAELDVAIAWALIDAENARSTVRIREGASSGGVTRTYTATAGKSRTDAIEELANMDGGFGFVLDPVADVPGILAELVTSSRTRSDHEDVRFEYGAGTLDNCSEFSEELRAPVNRVTAQGSALPDGTRPTQVAEDTASQETYGLFEQTISVETTDAAVLTAQASAALRPEPVGTYTVTPTEEAPVLFETFDVGDLVRLTLRKGRVDVAGTARVDEATIKRSASGVWRLDSLTLSDPNVHRVARRPDDRLFALLGAYRDRLAILERAKLVGA